MHTRIAVLPADVSFVRTLNSLTEKLQTIDILPIQWSMSTHGSGWRRTKLTETILVCAIELAILCASIVSAERVRQFARGNEKTSDALYL